MGTKLVVVEEAFEARGKGVLVSPRITWDRADRGPMPVRLVLPGGAERDATASIEVAHVRGPLPPYAMVRLVDLRPEDVPAGTEVWTCE